MSRAGVAVLGSFMMDLVAHAPRPLQPGETLEGTFFGRYLGGKGINQAVAAARLGADVTMIGRVGDDDFGREFLDTLAREGVDAAHVGVDPDEGTGVGLPVIYADSRENSIIIVPRANSLVTPEHVQAAAGAIGSADALLIQLELPAETAVTAARIAKQAGTRVICDPAPAGPAVERLRDLVDYLLPNDGEAKQLAGITSDGDDGQAAAAALRRDWGLDAVLITLGERGVIVIDQHTERHICGVPVDAVSTVGAGDAFAGALAVRLAADAELGEAARYATMAAAISCTRPGAVDAMATDDEVEAHLASTT